MFKDRFPISSFRPNIFHQTMIPVRMSFRSCLWIEIYIYYWIININTILIMLLKGLATFWEYMFYSQKKRSLILWIRILFAKKIDFHTFFLMCSNLGLITQTWDRSPEQYEILNIYLLNKGSIFLPVFLTLPQLLE